MMHPRLLILRPFWLFLAATIYGGVLLFPLPGLLVFRIAGASGGLLTMVIVPLALVAPAWTLVTGRKNPMEGAAQWFLSLQFRLSSMWLGIESHKIVFVPRDAWPASARGSALWQILLSLPCLVIVTSLSGPLLLTALPVYVFALIAGRVPQWWTVNAGKVLQALARGSCWALLGRRWSCDVRVPAEPAA